jgi:hypothetical protein
MPERVTIPISVKKGTEVDILNATGSYIGEPAFSTNTRAFFIWSGIAWIYTNGVQIGNLNERPSSGILGRLFYAEDEGLLYTDLVTEWTAGFTDRTYVDNLITTVSGDIISYVESNMATLTTLSGVGGIYTTQSGNVWYIGSQDQLVPVSGEHVLGQSIFSVSGTSITHNLNNLDHFLTVIPAGTDPFNEYAIASVGNVYIQLGVNTDIVWNTGGAGAEGIQFFWDASTETSFITAASTNDLLTLSGSLIAYFDNLLTTVSGTIPTVVASGIVMGTGEFDYSGYAIIHNLGTTSHYVSVTPADLVDFDELLIASIGEIYVKKGANQDTVYHTGGEVANGVKFDWEAIKHGLRMVE